VTSGSQPGLLTNGSAPASTSATAGPVGHRVDSSHRDCEFGRVITQTHDPVKGTIYPSSAPPRFPVRLEIPRGVESLPAPNPLGCEAWVSLGKLPKMNFPKFENENPKLWQSCCETYFEMYGVDPNIWVRVATIRISGCELPPATRWLQSINHRMRSASWKELCSWIHDRFSRDQRESLIRQLFHIKHVGTVKEYIDKFSELVDQLVAYEHSSDLRYYTTHFVDGLKDDVKAVVLVQWPADLDTSYTLALLQEEADLARRHDSRRT
jgi:hypothetical protein